MKRQAAGKQSHQAPESLPLTSIHASAAPSTPGIMSLFLLQAYKVLHDVVHPSSVASFSLLLLTNILCCFTPLCLCTCLLFTSLVNLVSSSGFFPPSSDLTNPHQSCKAQLHGPLPYAACSFPCSCSTQVYLCHCCHNTSDAIGLFAFLPQLQC